MSELQLPLGSKCIKYLLFIFNLLFVITGLILLILGAYIKSAYMHPQFLDDKFFSIPNLLIAVGAIIFFIAFFGCCGAVRENYCMVIVFTGFLILIFILEVSGGIAGYVLRHEAGDLIRNKMLAYMEHAYNGDTNSSEATEAWSQLQTALKCCGTNNETDWIEMKRAMPLSCCNVPYNATGTLTCDEKSPYIYHDGCWAKLTDEMKEYAVSLGGAGFGIAFIQAIGIWFSIYLARAIRANYETV